MLHDIVYKYTQMGEKYKFSILICCSRGDYDTIINICVNTKILSCVLIARSISVEIKTCLQYILHTMSRPYSAHDLRWRMVYQRLFYQRRYKEIASQLFVCPKTVYRTITFLNSGDVKPYRLGRPTGSASLFDHEGSIHNGLYSSNPSDTAT